MAFFKLFKIIEGADIANALREHLAGLGLIINPHLSNRTQVYASDHDQPTNGMTSRVTLLASWRDQSIGEVQIEVRSDEPMLRSGTRCECIAMALQRKLPPNQSTPPLG